ncbi:E3 SUMO-protein ligase RanBP2 isoform X2 [Myzus persicae]|uniref:E3 SUMO-protein ligase RanBP2 isoform X2 n=1 Tax=Myzus persicae TaxID=13164 RepID=UPI000B9308F4|nr:E3 SUMO-protein ligase RanBP2 isoform X2 [Myzus persicae]
MLGLGNAVLYRSKKDIDRHVREQFDKLSNEHEKKLKGLAIARMYFKVSEFELAKQYVITFLSVNENSPEGRRLLGHCYDKLGNKEKAVLEYQKSLTSTPNQPELLLLCCELMVDPSVKLNDVQAEKICKQTEDLYPYHPTVYKLKDRLLASNGNCDPSKAENLLNAEISVRPEDMNLRIKQLKLFESSGRLSEAYSCAMNIEKNFKFQKDNVEWYETVSQICEAYGTLNTVNWEFYSRVLPVYEHTASLFISESKTSKQKTISECYKVLFRLDQALYKAIQISSPQTEFYRSLIQHLSNQFYFHLASVIMKLAKKENSTWSKTNQLAAPLFLMSLAPPIDKQAFDSITNKEFSMEQKSNVALWELEGTRRIIESGFVLRAMMAKEDEHFIDNVKLLCINDWKTTNFKKIFNDPEYAKGVPTSLFIHYSPEKLVYNIPELIQYAVPKHMLSFEMSRPGSLHHLVWYGIQLLESENKGCGLRLTKNTLFPVGFGCKSFNELPLATNSLASANIESICQIDMNTFLYATVLSVASFLDNQSQSSDPKAPQTFPSNITDQLTTSEQENWWKSMYKIYSKNVDVKHVSQLRKAAIQGLESIRLIGNHGIDVQLMVYLAKNFASQANKIVDNFLLKEGLEKRATLYWGMAIQLLERINERGIEHKSKNTLFEFYRKKLTPGEVFELLEEGKFYLACQLMNNGQNEEAIEAFKNLNLPYASFYQAMIYKKMIKSPSDTSADNTLSNENSMLVAKVKELLNITKDRLKKLPYHPLHSTLKEEFLDLKLDIDMNGTLHSQSNLNLSGEDYNDNMNASRRHLYNKFGERSFLNVTSTPVKSPLTPVRRTLDDETDVKLLSELKVAVQSQNVQCQTLGLQYYNMIETLRSMSEKVDKLFDHFNNTKDSIFDKINELSHLVSTNNSTATTSDKPEMNSNLIERIDKLEGVLMEKLNAMNEIKTRHDDLYAVYAENGEEFDKINYDQSSCIQNAFDDQTQMTTLSFPTTQLPFSSSLPFQQFGLFNPTSQSNQFPSYSMAPNPNVNITSSDTLPTGPPVSQPPLSVIIPTHHILGGSLITSEAPSYPFKFNSQLVNNQSQSVISHGLPSIQPITSVDVQNTDKFSFQSPLSTFKESYDTSLNKSKNSATDDSYNEEHDPIPEFQPIIPLPDKIEEVTGEENDTILFEKRAKLYKYIEKEWKEKGIGILKILKNRDTNKVRLVMRREQVHKVCANHFLYDNMELKSKSDKAVVWSANDFSDAVQVQIENLCARFKTVEDCKEFMRVFNENKQPCSQNSSLVDNSKDDYNESVFEVNNDSSLKLSLENEKSLKHELGGFTFSSPPIINDITTPKQHNKTPDKAKGLFSNLSFSTPIGDTATPSLKSILKPMNSETKTGTNDKQSFSFNTSKSGIFSTETTPKPTEKSEIFSSETTPKSTEKSLFSFNNVEEKSAMFTPKLDFTSGTSATSYFSTLAKNSPNLGFTNSPDFKGFPGAGSTIFGSKVKTNPSPHAIIKSEDANISSSSQPNDESEEFVPTAEFSPVIPLPEKVDLVTGEEGLKIIFDDRAKLLRYDSSTKEWKEKGIGQMKILHNPKDDYYQLLMRREIVLKICCNQRLTADLVLNPVPSSDKAMSWVGKDFSEGEGKKEVFAIKFKTVGQLHAFKEKFNEIRSKLQELKEVSSSTEAKVVEKQSDIKLEVSKPLPKLNDLSQFKPKPGSWTCDACYLSNINTVKCIACLTVKPGAVVDDETTKSQSTTGFTFGQTSFSSSLKFGDALSNSQPGIPFVMPTFGTPSAVSFSSLSTSEHTNTFGIPIKTAVHQKKPLTWREESAGLVKYDSDKSADESNEGTDETDNESDGNDGQKSVFENEKTQFSSNVKIEKSSFKIDNSSTALKPSENQVKIEKPSSSIDNSALKSSDNQESVKILDVKSLKDVVSHTDQELAEELKLPLAFFLYKSKPKCKGCVGCEEDSENEIERVKEQDEVPVSVSESNITPVTLTNNISQSFHTTSFLFGDKSSTNIFEKNTPVAPVFGSKPVFGSFSSDSTKTDDTKSTSLFGLSSNVNPSSIFSSFCASGSTESPNTSQSSLFSKTDDIKSKTEGLFNFSPKTDSPFKFGTISKDPKSVFGQGVFGVKDKITVDESAPKANPWSGTFNLKKSTDEEKNCEKVEENGDEEVDNSHDPHFEPIIPLPDAIEVSTGEENEKILFCERSKLYRKDGSEYKERGIGEMKILFDPERNTYRFLFRREKVFKVVCNHLITSDLQLVAMISSNKAFCWPCMNITADNPDPQKEMLAVRFKNEEIAGKFKQVFDDCVSKLHA